MKEILRKGLILGLGAASLTRRKAEKTVKELIKKGAVNSKEGRILVKRVLGEAKKQEAKLRRIGEAEAKKVLKKVGIISIAEAKKLKGKVAVLEKKLMQKTKKVAKRAYKRVKRRLR